MSTTNSFNYLFLKRFAHLLHVFVPFSRLSLNVHNHNERIYTHPLILLLLILINEVGLQFVIYLVGLLPSQFYVELSKTPDKRDFAIFRWLVIRSFGYVTLNAFLKSLSTFLSSILYVKWRMRLVLYLHSFYFTQQRYYHLSNTTQQNQNRNDDDHVSAYENHSIQTVDIAENAQESIGYMPTESSQQSVSTQPPIDNPDQRITQDVDSLCRTLSIIIPLIVISPFTIAYYTYRTWKITGYYGPLAIIVYFILWTCINKILISAVSRTIFRQNICEGNFRFLHTQIRTHNEPIAFYNGGSFEHKRFDNYFIQILTPLLYRRTIQEFFLSLSTNLFDYIGSILSYLLLALAIFVFHFYDNVPSEQLVKIISQTSFITMYLIYRFSQLNDLTDKLTVIAANTHRVQTFVEYMINIDTTWSEKQLNRTIQQNEILIIKNLSYSTPNNSKHILMKNLNLILHKGQRLLITGDSGIGKTSLFRVLHSIWPVNINGSFSYNTAHAFLLPQRPYFTNQSLYDELSYPDVKCLPTITRQIQIEHLLNEWNLLHILDCVESNVFTCPKYAWQDLLSPGELQRLSFVRLLFRLSPHEDNESSRINLVFLDEITSSLDVNTEMKMYNYLVEQSLTLISIGHRETLRQYHQLELKLYKNGKYSLDNLEILA
ncbi:unnamed protein product [Rotaria sp. Silwood2]|nr:unnamed protein product [Rotaria sp. Silwood2]CAF2602931.1 unnamed protein product [Rotaria sp. Silwood2]CAF2820081.1 unnamed protein product [Rotaria sp. Silwood2]CAF3874517.1 unnamed protein product [Rotaria sp. Silwood2]CAF4437172.1 unnamed protein product [Rotaria sp. Silwood2]